MRTSSATTKAERLPLTGADCFLRAFDAETRRRAAASHLSQLVLRLGPGFDPEALDRVLAEVARAQPILSAPIRRAGGVGAPVYRLDLGRRRPPPRVERHELPAAAARPAAPGQPAPLPELFARRLSERRSGRRGELLRVDAVRYDAGRAGTDLAFTWLHMLFDGAGSEAFVSFLEACRAGGRAPQDVPEADRPGAPPDLPLPAGARERGDLALGWQRRMHALGARSVRSLAGPLRGVRQDLTVDLRV
ncbi:MAG: hypothetical protein R3263_00435, partial [Myxococcota bacterium]|nr:hypothetical protein [Myxococcota bacterium]